jgi:predicted DNA-binding transcriptional regulator YafY
MARQIEHADAVSESDLLKTFPIGRRTLARDLRDLEREGFTRHKEGRETFVRPPERVVAPRANLQDFVSLEIVLSQEGPALHMPGVRAALESLKERVETAMSPAQRSRAGKVHRAFYSPEKFRYREPPAPFVTELVEAIADKRLCEIVHHPQGRRDDKPKMVLPLRLFPHDGALYLHAATSPGNKLGVYNLRRVERLRVLADHGVPPAGFDPKAWHLRTFGVAVPETEPVEIVLRFEPRAAPMIRERVWHPTQKLRDLPDGSVELRFTCGLSYEVDTFVTRWGKGVVVVAPQELRDRMSSFGEWLSSTYPTAPRNKKTP